MVSTGDPFPDPGGFDLQGLMAQAQHVQQQLVEAQEQLAAATIEGSAGGGLVTATVSGTGELLDLRIAPQALATGAVDPADTEAADTVADLVLAAVRDAVAGSRRLAEQTLGPVPAGLGGLGGGAPASASDQ